METIRVNGLDLDLSVYTTDASSFRAQAWTRTDGGFASTRLALCDETSRESADERCRAELRVLPSDDGLARFQITARHALPIKAAKFAMDLPYMPQLAPEQLELESCVWRQTDFPRDWRTGFAVWQAPEGFFTVCTHEAPWRFKRMRVLRTGDRMRLEIIQDANVRDRSMTFESSVWEVGFRRSLEPLLNQYADFVRRAFGAGPFESREDLPQWLRGVALVVNLHGTDWPGHTHLDFDGMRRAAGVLADLFEPERTILYLIGWDGRYMRNYPDYEPSSRLGGPEAFARFCHHARECGFHVMPHLNAMAVSMRHPLYLTHLKDYVMRDHNGVPQHSYKIDWDADGLGDAAHAYVSLVPPALREILAGAVSRLVEQYGIDAIFLDETCNVFYNDAAWDQVEGVRLLVRDIRQRHPGLLIAGEEWNEMLLGLTPLVQMWEETADGRKGFGREKSPLMREWAGRFIRGCGYLALASPDGSSGVHEWPDRPWVDERQNEAFYIPTLSIASRTMDTGMDGIRACVRRARDYAQRFTDR